MKIMFGGNHSDVSIRNY